MPIEDSLKKMLRQSADEASTPDLERFRQCIRDLSKSDLLEERDIRLRDWAVVRMCALGVAVISAVVVAISTVWFVTVEYPAGIVSQRDLARAQRIGPLLPALSSDNPEHRSIAVLLA